MLFSFPCSLVPTVDLAVTEEPVRMKWTSSYDDALPTQCMNENSPLKQGLSVSFQCSEQ